MRFFKRNLTLTHDYTKLSSSIEMELQAERDYIRHLEDIGPNLPDETRSFALSDWYRNPTHHDCPHDGWLFDIHLIASTSVDRSTNLDLTVLGAYRDRLLSFHYSNVTEMECNLPRGTDVNVGDWLADEFTVVEQGLVSHEIAWDKSRPWRIIARRVRLVISDVR